jgi:hypothetical protein
VGLCPANLVRGTIDVAGACPRPRGSASQRTHKCSIYGIHKTLVGQPGSNHSESCHVREANAFQRCITNVGDDISLVPTHC